MQTVYNINMGRALPGMVDDSSRVIDHISRLVETAGGLDAGVFCKAGTDKATQIVAVAAAGDITGGLCLGAVMYDASKDPSVAASSGPGHLDVKQSATVVKKGRIWCRLDTAEAPTDGADVFVRFQGAGAGEGVGWVRTDADTADAAKLEGAVFRSGAVVVSVFGTSIRLALVELNLPTA